MSSTVPVALGAFTYGPRPGRWWYTPDVGELIADALGSPEQGLDGDDTVFPARDHAVQQAVTSCLETGRAFALVSEHEVSGGHRRWVVWTGVRTATRGRYRVEGHVVEVTATWQQALSEQITLHLDAALAGRRRIDLAKGALMLVYGMDAEAAFDLLVWSSQRWNTRVSELAQRLTDAMATGEGAMSRPALEGQLVDPPWRFDAALPVDTRPGRPRRPLTLQATTDARGRAVRVRGDVDLVSGQEWAARLSAGLEALTAGDTLCLDLTGVDYLGPVGLSVLASAARRARAAGIAVAASATSSVTALLAVHCPGVETAAQRCAVSSEGRDVGSAAGPTGGAS